MHAAFKEWAIVCEALGTGRQSVILRKGGVAEGSKGFAFRHREFLLLFQRGFTNNWKRPPSSETRVPERPERNWKCGTRQASSWSDVPDELGPGEPPRSLHVLREGVVGERYRYSDSEGVHVAFVRVYRLDPPLRIKNEKKYGGCRSWVELPEIEDRFCSGGSATKNT